MTRKWGHGKFHSRSGKRQKEVVLRVLNGAFERKDGSLGGQKTVFGSAGNGSLPLNEWFVEGQ